MSVRSIRLSDLAGVEVIPQAVIEKPLSFFKNSRGIQFIDSYDDLDYYRGAAFFLADNLPFVLKHYRGEPADTTTVYLSREIRDTQEISRIPQSYPSRTKNSARLREMATLR